MVFNDIQVQISADTQKSKKKLLIINEKKKANNTMRRTTLLGEPNGWNDKTNRIILGDFNPNRLSPNCFTPSSRLLIKVSNPSFLVRERCSYSCEYGFDLTWDAF